jgi:hypothetical protein
MRTRLPSIVLAAAALPLIAATACSGGGSPAATAPGDGGAATQAASTPAASSTGLAAGGSDAVSGDGCDLVTVQQLSQATGAQYSAIKDNGGLCNVTAANLADAFYFHVDKEDGTMTTWASELATIKEDDGTVTSVPGLGDRAAQGAIKEFAAETGGYIIVVANADVNNPPTAASFTRSKKIEQLLVSKV